MTGLVVLIVLVAVVLAGLAFCHLFSRDTQGTKQHLAIELRAVYRCQEVAQLKRELRLNAMQAQRELREELEERKAEETWDGEGGACL